METVVIVELKLRGAELWYLRSESGQEVNELALLPDGRQPAALAAGVRVAVGQPKLILLFAPCPP